MTTLSVLRTLGLGSFPTGLSDMTPRCRHYEPEGGTLTGTGLSDLTPGRHYEPINNLNDNYKAVGAEKYVYVPKYTCMNATKATVFYSNEGLGRTGKHSTATKQALTSF